MRKWCWMMAAVLTATALFWGIASGRVQYEVRQWRVIAAGRRFNEWENARREAARAEQMRGWLQRHSGNRRIPEETR